MSWIQKLYETYERCNGHEPDPLNRLMPISHTTQQVQIELVIDELGMFRRAAVVDKTASTTLIPCTEESGGRSGSKPTSHPLCDKLQYVAGDFLTYGGEVTSGFSGDPLVPHRDYMGNLIRWAESANSHPKVIAICNYLKRGHVVQDLLNEMVLHSDEGALLLQTWVGDKESMPKVFKVLSATQIQGDAFIRWVVETPGDLTTGTWQDPTLIAAWIAHYQSGQSKRGQCIVTGSEVALAVQHPAKLRHGGDKAKLISANDSTGYTFRGRFLDADEAAGVAFEVTQKAHNALRWLIATGHGYHDRASGQVFVAWARGLSVLPDLAGDTYAFMKASEAPNLLELDHGTDQAFAVRLSKAILGYRAKLDPTDDIMVLGLDSATPGRMAITFYREIKGSEFLDRIEAWHHSLAWPQNFGKDRHFVGAPSPRDIAEAAYGRRLDDKLRKATVERVLPCIVDGQEIPRDLMQATARRAVNRSGLERWEWEKCLGIACALFKGYHSKEGYQMTLETDRSTRDYVYGRLLAVADSLESFALRLADETRDTTASRLMQRFADHPFSTWRTIELALKPYQSRLRAGGAMAQGFLRKREALLDELLTGLNDMPGRASDSQLTPEFLLGYHCQRQAFKKGSAADEESTSGSETTAITTS